MAWDQAYKSYLEKLLKLENDLFALFRPSIFLSEISIQIPYLLTPVLQKKKLVLKILVRWFNQSVTAALCSYGLSECLAAAPVFLLGATRHFVLFSCKICAEIVVHRMFAVSLNGLNGKSSSRSIVQKILFRFICFILGFKISYSEYSFVTTIVI